MNRFQIFIIHIDIENMGIWFVTPIPANQIIRIPFFLVDRQRIRKPSAISRHPVTGIPRPEEIMPIYRIVPAL